VRAREHGRAARLLAADHESPERVAAQLLRCPPTGDPWAFEQLYAAARIASAGAAADAIATYLRRALEEPPPPDQRAAVLLKLGRAESHFDPVSAIAHLREALAAEADPERRFTVALLLAGMLGQTGHAAEGADVLESQLGGPDGKVEAALANITRIDPTIRRRGDAAVARMRVRVHAGENDPAVLGALAAELAMAGEPAAEAAKLAERAIAATDTSATTAVGWSWHNAVRTLMFAERYDLALPALDAELERNRERGSLIDVGGVLTFRAELYVHMGDLANAEVDARTLIESSAVYGWPLGLGMGTAVLGEVLVERGELAQAEELLFGAPYDGDVPHVYMNLWVLRARGLLRVAQGRHAEAAEELREAGRRALAIDHVNPAVLSWRAPLDDPALVAEELERARAFGGRRALGIALLAQARLTGELEPLREAVAVLDASQAALETARAHFALGAALRRAGEVEPARHELRRAVDGAHRCGATALEDAALAELRATGARPRRRLTTGAGALTPSERRIAGLAADGRQNREIAEALFITTATVEFHLRNAFRKLGISTRAQLAESL
jgi:DNA-binding CsgD family transcriptional regulator